MKPAHLRLTYSGTFGPAGAPVEAWSFSLNCADDASLHDASDATLDALAGYVGNQYSVHFGDVMPSNVRLTEARVACIDGAGLTRRRADGTYVQGIYAYDAPGGMAASSMPLQTALCVSLNTSRPGPTGKGRFFLPWPAISLSTVDRRVPAEQITDLADDLQAFLNGINNHGNLQLVVASSKGYVTPVSSVRVGRTPDTMRSRREDSPEGYIQVPLA